MEDNESIAGHEGGADEMFLPIEPAAAAAVSVRSEPGWVKNHPATVHDDDRAIHIMNRYKL